MYTVYKHTSPCNKVYIGITSNSVVRRWNNGHGYKSNEYFTNAIKKYGWKNFKHEILFTNLSKEEAEQIEIELIRKYNSRDRRYGYNHAIGGATNRGYKLSDEAKRKIGETHRGRKRKHSKETREKISKAKMGEKNWLYGKHLSKEHKRKVSEALKGKKKPPRTQEHLNNLPKKSVICLDTNTVYTSLAEAERQTGANYHVIIKVCKGEGQTAGGYRWQYAD